ncbi:PREDICTED: transcriptional adapter 3-A-like [Diuraphis noxia]|uniref:transcriptional adapter 3-A-like n=1 Tax=Diuraphis noxia TaxID=143948 RepID=UPI0007639D37|nr:PREDICTED: transcriptional adapter 3-A-like [Diuraphis noxia]
MSSKKQTQREEEPSGIRKSTRKRRPKLRQSLSPNKNMPTTSNIKTKRKATTKIHTVFDERVLSLSRLKPTQIKHDSAIQYVLNQEERDDIEQIITDDILDKIQWEFESMLTGIIVRKKQIKNVYNLLSSVQESGSPNKVENNCKQSMNLAKVAAEIFHDDECSSNLNNVEFENEELPPIQTESAKKFWSLVEPYLADVSDEDLKWLEDLVMSYSSKLDKIPPLGEHYSKRWVREELKMQDQQASSSHQPNMKTRLADRVPPDVVELVNRANNAARGGHESMPLFQKIMAAILEHTNMSQNDIDNNSEIDGVAEDRPEEMSNVCEEFYGEQNIRKQLQKLGLIGNQDKPVASPSSLPHSSSQATVDSDEILEEIVKCDSALSNLREMNKNHLSILLERCRERHSMQKKKKKLQKLDDKILNFKKQGNSQKKNVKTGQTSNKNEDIRFVLNKRSNYLKRLQSCATDPINMDDSESSDEDVKNECIVISDDCIVISDSDSN